MSVDLILGDCIDAMKAMPDNSIDAVVTDPPYELGFMGKSWDNTGVAYQVGMWAEVLRVLKPGGHLLSFGGSRTYHRMACAIEDAGFEIRDQLQWIYSQGFPKSLNIGKQMEKLYGCAQEPKHDMRHVRQADLSKAVTNSEAEWQILQSSVPEQSIPIEGWGQFPDAEIRKRQSSMEGRSNLFQETRELQTDKIREMPGGISDDGTPGWLCNGTSADNGKDTWQTVTTDRSGAPYKPRSAGQQSGELDAISEQQAAQIIRRWKGWGTALKPAHECICMARKPISEGTVAKNVLAYGTGGINIDGCRIGTEQTVTRRNGDSGGNGAYGRDERIFERTNPPGRFPANILHDGSDEVVGMFPQCKQANDVSEFKQLESMRFSAGGEGVKPQKQTNGKIITASAARFFYCAKASRSERNAGLEGMEERGDSYKMRNSNGESDGWGNKFETKPMQNHHPTVKPISVMRWLVRLITPPNGTVLDPFTGSGTTGIAAVLEGFDFIGIEREAEYHEIARRRIEHWQSQFQFRLPLEVLDANKNR